MQAEGGGLAESNGLLVVLEGVSRAWTMARRLCALLLLAEQWDVTVVPIQIRIAGGCDL
jgi:hypothetical protein